MSRWPILLVGVLAVLGLTWLWHGPLGVAESFQTNVERSARSELDHLEMTQVQAQLGDDRTLVLSGPADDFQRGELVRIMGAQPGVARVRWQDGEKSGGLPLLIEAELYALAGFCLGLLLSYLLELRRRSRAEWRW